MRFLIRKNVKTGEGTDRETEKIDGGETELQIDS